MVIWRTVDPIDHCRTDPDGLYVFDAHHRLGLVFFAVAIVAIYGQTFPAMLDYPEVVVRLTLWCIVVGLYPTLLMTLIGVLWFPSRTITQMHQALNDRLDDAISHLTDSLAPLRNAD